MQPAQKTLAFIKQHDLIRPGERVGVAVSGGADSVSLLRILLELRGELGILLSVVHFDHQLRGAESDADRDFVCELAARHSLEIHQGSGDVKAHAKRQRMSLETAARDARYAYFQQLLQAKTLDSIATGHTLDDQAETVLMRVVRGAGTRGLAGIYPALFARDLENQTEPTEARPLIIRPLLSTRRTELEAYLQEIAQPWREDGSNLDLRHARNRVRHGILPRIERHLNPAIRENLADLAEISRDEESFWEAELGRVWPQVWIAEEQALKISELPRLPLALQRRVVRRAGEQHGLRLEFRQVQEMLQLLRGDSSGVELSGAWRAFPRRGKLYLKEGETSPASYDYSLSIPGRTHVPELGSCFEVLNIAAGDRERYDADQLLDPKLVEGGLRVRNWRPGDRFWPAHRKDALKVKELLQERRVTGPERKAWPVVVHGQEVIWLRGFPVALQCLARNGTDAIVIREASTQTS